MTSLKKNKKNMTRRTRSEKKVNDETSVSDCVKERKIEIIIAALLLSGKLRFDSIQLFREAALVVSLVGKYETLVDLNNNDLIRISELFNKNGNMTINEIIEQINKS
ncbi:hypothetical protein DFQ01_10815 [Paenibacillus cellulosilyticus]|uniref:Uncharacterized protein n=1 Tax=Paenibacillus cellulosilyticus TaxID=375489 RepID=A0A2V2Z276_9BACL|nr:hypothetical protein [Paenibacillus cellulosilyticus]PWW02741.1 hypothetical protein DFQ01_10815 [Paenibacillus cellulosilyticus]QKS45667.1 hypothetical protein HUB94_15420 [Paenibacillus cellulosilyticus]